MKKISFIYILVCLGFMTNAQIQHEDFNATSIPDGWSVTKPESGCTWKFGYKGDLKGSGFQNPASFQSGGVVFNDNDCGGFKNNHIELISPTVNLIEKKIVEASIEITYNLRTFSNDGSFMVNVWDGTIWQNVLTTSEDTNAINSGENQTIIVDVSQYINNAFKVKFIYDDGNTLTWGVGIDDYKLIGVVSSDVDGFESIGFSYYPNPVINNELTLLSSKNISIINVYNSIGQRVLSKNPVTLETKLDMHNLTTGTYLIEVTIGTKEGSFKIIKH
ncbi:MAG: T9SS type A sorting domain-containing protein [Flavobacteriaceae bacterium]|nr:T9SS type A sorting domain-containing protein [Flavobacteriaceae bacterium]